MAATSKVMRNAKMAGAEAECLERIGRGNERHDCRGKKPDRATDGELHAPALTYLAYDIKKRRADRPSRIATSTPPNGCQLCRLQRPSAPCCERREPQAVLYAVRDNRCASTDSPVRSRIPANSKYHQSRCDRSWASSGSGCRRARRAAVGAAAGHRHDNFLPDLRPIDQTPRTPHWLPQPSPVPLADPVPGFRRSPVHSVRARGPDPLRAAGARQPAPARPADERGRLPATSR